MTSAEKLADVFALLWRHLAGLTPMQLGANTGLTVLAAAIGWAVVWGAQRLLCYGAAMVPGGQTPDGMARARKAMGFTGSIVAFLVALVGVVTIATIWGFDIFTWISQGVGRQVAHTIFTLALILISTAIGMELAGLFIRYTLTRLKGRADLDPRRGAQLDTLGPILRRSAQLVILLLGVMTFLSQVGVQIAPLLAGAGVVGIAVGFGAQTLVKDFFTGFFLLVEDIVAVGDIVQIQTFSGEVEDMTLRTIRLRDFDGTLHIFPYGEAQIIHNLTKTFSFAAFDLPVRLDTDLDKAMAVMKTTADELRHDQAFGPLILGDIEIPGPDLLSDIGIILKGRIRTQPMERWIVLREYNRRIKAAFEAAGIVLTHKA